MTVYLVDRRKAGGVVMVSLMPMACIAEDLTQVARAEAVIAAAGDHLALPPADLPPTALGCQLDDLRQRLEQRIALSPSRRTIRRQLPSC